MNEVQLKFENESKSNDVWIWIQYLIKIDQKFPFLFDFEISESSCTIERTEGTLWKTRDCSQSIHSINSFHLSIFTKLSFQIQMMIYFETNHRRQWNELNLWQKKWKMHGKKHRFISLFFPLNKFIFFVHLLVNK